MQTKHWPHNNQMHCGKAISLSTSDEHFIVCMVKLQSIAIVSANQFGHCIEVVHHQIYAHRHVSNHEQVPISAYYHARRHAEGMHAHVHIRPAVNHDYSEFSLRTLSLFAFLR